jgi:hypothetical protein
MPICEQFGVHAVFQLWTEAYLILDLVYFLAASFQLALPVHCNQQCREKVAAVQPTTVATAGAAAATCWSYTEVRYWLLTSSVTSGPPDVSCLLDIRGYFLVRVWILARRLPRVGRVTVHAASAMEKFLAIAVSGDITQTL